jgi:hypothetical protein
MIRKNKRRFDPRYFMDEKTDKKVIKEAEFKYDAPSKTGIPDELATAATAMDFEKYPVTPEEQAGEDMAEFLEQMFVEEGGDKSWLGNYDSEILQMAMALRDSNITPADFPEMADDPIVSQIRTRILEMADESANLDQFGNPIHRYEDEEEEDYVFRNEPLPLSEMPKPGAASYGDIGLHSPRSAGDSDIVALEERLKKMEEALGRIGNIAHTAAGIVKTEND